MPSAARRVLLPLVMLGWLVAGRPAAAATSGVEDGAGFFGAAAVQKAREEIKEIKSRFNKDLLIETFKTIPPERKGGQDLTGEARNQFFEKWVADRIREAKLDGIYVLITREPGHIQVGVSEDMLKKGFPRADRDRLRNLLLEKFKAREYDAGLSDGVRLVQETLARNLLPRPVGNVVKDYGGFFSPEAVQKADADLKEINGRTKKNIIIETFKTVPANDVQRVEKMTPQERRKYFEGWMRSRTQGVPFDIYVLITREPGHLQVGIGPEAAKGAFPVNDRNQLDQILLSKFKDKEYDQGLREGIDYIRKTLYARLNVSATPPRSPATARTSPTPAATVQATNRTAATPATTIQAGSARSSEKSAAPATTPDTQKAASTPAAVLGAGDKPPPNKAEQLADKFQWSWVLWIIGGLLVLWVVYGIIRGLMHSSRSQAPSQGYPPPQPGSYPGQQPGPHPGTGQQVVGPGHPAGGTPYTAGQPMPPAGAPGHGPGYGPGQPGGYGPGVPYGGGGGRTGGFLSGMLGGMFGAAAGNWVYDSFLRGGSHPQPGVGGGIGPRAYGGEPHHPYDNPPPGAGSFGGAAAGGGISSTGGDFDASPGGQVESTGGDFDAGDNPADTGAGGDFGEPAAGGVESTGGDFDSNEDTGSSGGDFGGDSGGGDFGGDSGGGDFGGDSGGGDFGGGDSGGGDFGGGDSGGGDFGGGDSGGGDF